LRVNFKLGSAKENSFFNEKLRDYGLPIGIDEFSGDVRDMVQPLVNQPGEKWEYGVSASMTVDEDDTEQQKGQY
jgi:hypothetical protein